MKIFYLKKIFINFSKLAMVGKKHLSIFCFFVYLSQAQAQVVPLTLHEVLNNASAFYPALRAARFEAKAASDDADAVRRQRWPVVSVTSESNSGNLRTYPSKFVQVQQTVWDFGRLSARIAEAEASADISALNVYLEQQDLFLKIISAWQNLQSGRERAKVAESALERLTDYHAQMRRRVEAEVSPRIDLELIEARLLQTEVELMTAKTSTQVALTRLEQLSGLERLAARIDKVESVPNLKDTQAFTDRVNRFDLLLIASDGPLAARARAQLKQSEQRLDSKKSEAWPQVYVRAYKPLNAIPTSTDTSTTTFVGLSYTPGAGLSNLVEARALASRISGAQFSVQSAILETQQILQSDREEYINARLRIASLNKAVNGSALVLTSYKRQFEAGKKTWLDLLNAVRELAQNEYNLVDAQVAMLGAMNRLQLRTGESLP